MEEPSKFGNRCNQAYIENVKGLEFIFNQCAANKYNHLYTSHCNQDQRAGTDYDFS